MAERNEQRLNRLLLLVPYVLANPGVSVKEVTKTFGISSEQLVSDLDLLFMCGRPGYGPGDLIEAYVDGDEVFIRMAEYFSQPLRLTPAEGLLLYAGARALLAAGDLDPALPRAIEKLAEAIGPEALARVEVGLDRPEDIVTVRSALDERRRIHIVYQSGSKEEVTQRDVDPWALFASGGHWYLVGWCHRVEAERIFRLDRMKQVVSTDRAATVPDDVDLSRYESIYVQSADSFLVKLDLAPDAARWVTESYPLTEREDLSQGWVRVTLTAGGPAWIEKLVLRLGTQVRVVEPGWLEESVRSLAERMKKRYEDS